MMKTLLALCVCIFFPLTVSAQDFAQEMRQLEQKEGGRLGVAAINMNDGMQLEYRAGEHFAMCSTYKLPLVAAVLARVDAGTEQLQRLVPYGEADMQSYAPITRKHLVDGSMTVEELSAAAIEYSDNTAANLLYKIVGGPEGLTEYVRKLGDETSHFDRDEPSLNTNILGDVRDTTTPSAMLALMQKLLLGNELSGDSKKLLFRWLAENTTGDARLRAGLNKNWKVGDKTGTGENGATNDVAFIWTSGRPILIVAYYSESTASQEKRNAVVAQVGRAVSDIFGKNLSGGTP